MEGKSGPSRNNIVSTTQRPTRTLCVYLNGRRTWTCLREKGSFFVAGAWYILFALIWTVSDYNIHNSNPSFFWKVGPRSVTAIMTQTRRRNRHVEDNEWEYDSNESNDYGPSPQGNSNTRPRNMRNSGRQQQQQRHSSQFFNTGDFQDRRQQQQQQQRQRTLNPFETFSQYILQGESSSNHQRKKLLSLFPTYKPRDMVDGIIILARSVLVGFGLGLVSLISIPVAEFSRLKNEAQESQLNESRKPQNRWVRLLVGGINGALLGSTFVVVGFVNGGYQALRGMISTPFALRAVRQGMIWDTNREKWKFYYLREELDELDSFQPFQDGARSVKDLTFYNMLDVPTNADVKEIKRSYHKKALAVHPDKNIGNQTASDEFRKLHAAYLTLIDTDQRMAYDRWGRSTEPGDHGGTDEAAGMSAFDANLFFTILFNTKPVEQFFGNSTMASLTHQSMLLWRSGYSDSPEAIFRLVCNNNPQAEHQRQRRHLNIALYLSQKIFSYINDEVSISDFRKRCRKEAIEIAREPFGLKYLLVIGETLIFEADRYTVTRTIVFGNLISQIKSMRHKVSAVKSSVPVLREIVNTAKLVKENDYSIEDEQKLITLLQPVMFEVGWMFHEFDIKHAVHRACLKLFADASVHSHPQRLKRAESIRILAEEFLLVAHQETERWGQSDKMLSTDDLSARIEVAVEISVMKASGFDIPTDIEERIQRAKAKRLQ